MKLTGKYRQKYERCNDKCADCSKPIWRPVRTSMTVYHLQEYYNSHNIVKTPESVFICGDNGSEFSKAKFVCYKCAVPYLVENEQKFIEAFYEDVK